MCTGLTGRQVAMEARIERVGTHREHLDRRRRRGGHRRRPGRDAGAVLAAVGEREVLAVICTHGHAAPRRPPRSRSPAGTRRRWRVHPADRLSWREAHARRDPDIEMEDGGIFEVADVALEVIHAPGHSPGSVCLYSEELGAVFSGDVLAADGPVPHEGDFPDFARQLSCDRRARCSRCRGRPGCCPATARSSPWPRRRSTSTPG